MWVSLETTTTGSYRDASAMHVGHPGGRSGHVRVPAAHGRGRRELHAVVVDLPLGEAVEHLVERDPALEPGERGAEAEVEAVAEGEVLAVVAVDVEPVGVGRSGARRGWPSRSSSSIALPAGTVVP